MELIADVVISTEIYGRICGKASLFDLWENIYTCVG
jgi:hypothetical protein